MSYTTQTILLAWSEQDVKAWKKGDRVIPLTAEAYISASKLGDANILDARDCIGQPQAVDEKATELLNSLHETLKSSQFPWLEAYANVIFEIKAFQLLTWLTLMRSLQQAVKPMQLEISPPQVFSDQSWSDDTFIYRLARESFGLARKVLEREGIGFTTIPPLPLLRPLRKRPGVQRAVGKGVAHALALGFSGLFGKNASIEGMPALQEGVDVVLSGQQYGDAFHCAPLAVRLVEKFGKRFLWISMRPQRNPNMTSEEKALVADLNLEQLRFVDSASFLARADKSRQSTLLDLGSAWQLARMLAPQKDFGVNRAEWFEFLMGPDFAGLAQRYRAWSRILKNVKPKVVIGLSALQDMALIRAWTRRNEVPFVCLMHGAFYAFKYSHDVDADYIGVFGKTLADQLKNSTLPQPRQVVSCGAMQFGDKAASAFQMGKAREKASNTDTVLFLGFFDFLPFCPWSPSETWRMLRDVHKVCCEWGKTLRVRPHPRYPASSWSPFVEELQRLTPGSVILSTEPSLSRDIELSEFVVASAFDGAVLDTLLAKSFLISYLPDGVEHIDYSRLLETMGGLARGFDELRALFASILSDSKRLDALKRTQERFLRNYIEGLESDPWEGSLNLIQEALDRVNSEDSSANNSEKNPEEHTVAGPK